ncbi:MAG: motif [Gemmatimonadetes bacterium]|nr:motif [Gemmatimonadota bacterium]
MVKVNRNDPCPCGSGRKYKACCMAAVQAAERAGVPVAAEELALTRSAAMEAARAADAWEVDLAPVNVAVRAGDAAPSMGLVIAGGLVVLGDVVLARPAGPA